MSVLFFSRDVCLCCRLGINGFYSYFLMHIYKKKWDSVHFTSYFFFFFFFFFPSIYCIYIVNYHYVRLLFCNCYCSLYIHTCNFEWRKKKKKEEERYWEINQFFLINDPIKMIKYYFFFSKKKIHFGFNYLIIRLNRNQMNKWLI